MLDWEIGANGIRPALSCQNLSSVKHGNSNGFLLAFSEPFANRKQMKK